MPKPKQRQKPNPPDGYGLAGGQPGMPGTPQSLDEIFQMLGGFMGPIQQPTQRELGKRRADLPSRKEKKELEGLHQGYMDEKKAAEAQGPQPIPAHKPIKEEVQDEELQQLHQQYMAEQAEPIATPAEETAQAAVGEQPAVTQPSPVGAYADEPETPTEEAAVEVAQQEQAAEAVEAEQAIEAQTQLEDMFPQITPQDILPAGMWEQLQQRANRKLSLPEIIAISGLAMVDQNAAYAMIERADQQKMTAQQNIQQIMQQVSIYNRDMARQRSIFQRQEMRQRELDRREKTRMRRQMINGLIKTAPGALSKFGGRNLFEMSDEEFSRRYMEASVDAAKTQSSLQTKAQLMQYGPNLVRTIGGAATKSWARELVQSFGADPDSAEWRPFIEGLEAEGAQFAEARRTKEEQDRARTAEIRAKTQKIRAEIDKINSELQDMKQDTSFKRYEKLMEERRQLVDKRVRVEERMSEIQTMVYAWEENNKGWFGGTPDPNEARATEQLLAEYGRLERTLSDISSMEIQLQNRVDQLSQQELPAALSRAQTSALNDLVDYMPEGVQLQLPLEQIISMSPADLQAPELRAEREIQETYWNLVTWRTAQMMGTPIPEIGNMASDIRDFVYETAGVYPWQVTQRPTGFAQQAADVPSEERGAQVESYVRRQAGRGAAAEERGGEEQQSVSKGGLFGLFGQGE